MMVETILIKEIESLKTKSFIGPPRKVRVFLCYSHKDKQLAGEIKRNLEKEALEIFLAHEDIEPSREWQDEIIKNLKSCDVFIPLLTRNFRESKWTDQETGAAVVQNKYILPLKVEITPYGFIEKYQAADCSSERVSKCCQSIVDLIRRQFREDLISYLIRSFVASGSFYEANQTAKLLEKHKPFEPAQINEIIRGYLVNDQIRGGFVSGPFVIALFNENVNQIDPDLKRIFEEFQRH